MTLIFQMLWAPNRAVYAISVAFQPLTIQNTLGLGPDGYVE